MAKSKFPVKKTHYSKKYTMGVDVEWALRLGVSYEPSYVEVSLYVGPFRFWVGK